MLSIHAIPEECCNVRPLIGLDLDIMMSQIAFCNSHAVEIIASTRSGLPLPSTIFSGAAITTAPFAGS